MLGPDLSNIASKAVEDIRESILDPDADGFAHYKGVTVTMKDGTTIKGVARNRSASSPNANAVLSSGCASGASVIEPSDSPTAQRRDITVWGRLQPQATHADSGTITTGCALTSPGAWA